MSDKRYAIEYDYSSSGFFSRSMFKEFVSEERGKFTGSINNLKIMESMDEVTNCLIDFALTADRESKMLSSYYYRIISLDLELLAILYLKNEKFLFAGREYGEEVCWMNLLGAKRYEQ